MDAHPHRCACAWWFLGSCSVEEEGGGCSAAQPPLSVQKATRVRQAHAGLHWAAPVIDTLLEQHICAVHGGSRLLVVLVCCAGRWESGAGGGVSVQGGLYGSGYVCVLHLCVLHATSTRLWLVAAR